MKRTKPGNIPADVYIQFVRSLFNSVHTVLVGSLIHTLLAFLVFWKNGNPIYIPLGILLFGVGIWRYLGMLKFTKTGTIANRAEAAAWERHYVIRGSVQALAIGLFCLLAFYPFNDHFAEMVAILMTFGSIVTVAGRNYGSPRMVAVFSAAFLLPIGVGLSLRANIPDVVLALTVFLFFFIVRSTADNVRDVLFSAVIGHRKAKQIAQRFDRALNTMPHGLVMLGPNGRVVVANSEAAHLMAAASTELLLGRSLKSLMMRGAAAGYLSRKDAQFAEAQLTRALHEGRDRKLLLSFSNGRHFEFSTREGNDELGVITFEDVTARVEAEGRVRFMARYDNLTGLPNRAYFHERVMEMMAGGDRDRLCGLAVFDLDDFKSVNDTLGHPVGDGLIYAVAERLGAFAEEDVLISRFGGDEFMIFFDRITDEADFTRKLDRIFEGLQGEVDVAGHCLRIQCSAGTVLGAVGETDVDGMIVKADLALYKAKDLGKNGWRSFETSMDEAFRNRQVMKADLRSAVEGRALRVVYQPIVAMDTMRIASCEALCRWDHPQLGPISPSVFIPLAEEMGIVSEISSFMLAAACAECARWPRQIPVSINLSARDFRNSEIVEKVRNALSDSGLEPHRLEIEVTETALLDDKASTQLYLKELKALGVRIALDDFGTGYSSLSYLHTLPLDKIKIDRSFLIDVARNERSLELLKGIVKLSRQLGLLVTVEGVETFEQLKILALKVRPDMVQGFLFGSALTASGIDTMSTTVWPFANEISVAKRAARR
ncbi:MAG: EAL domain-containing protein [Hyphomicrobiales bacterium]|nr:EAL domain-containing protein [Hyphomicrobiales bacterium]